MATRDGFAKPNLDKSSFKKAIPLKDGQNIFRLIPPVAKFSPDGSWYKYHKQHWGYGVKMDSGKMSPRTFACPQDVDFKTKKVKVPCAECDLIAQNEAAIERAKVKAQGLDPASRRTLLQPLADFRKSHNLDKKYYVNVKSGDGVFSYMALPYKVFDQMRTEMKNLKSQGMDAFDVDGGVWFNVTRTGEGLKTDYKLSIVREDVKLPDGRTAQMIKSAAMTEEEISQALSEAVDLNKLMTVISGEDIERLVDAKGNFDVAEAIFGKSQSRQDSDTGASSELIDAMLEEDDDGPMPTPPPTMAQERRAAPSTKVVAPPTTKATTTQAVQMPVDPLDDELDALFK